MDISRAWKRYTNSTVIDYLNMNPNRDDSRIIIGPDPERPHREDRSDRNPRMVDLSQFGGELSKAEGGIEQVSDTPVTTVCPVIKFSGSAKTGAVELGCEPASWENRPKKKTKFAVSEEDQHEAQDVHQEQPPSGSAAATSTTVMDPAEFTALLRLEYQISPEEELRNMAKIKFDSGLLPPDSTRFEQEAHAAITNNDLEGLTALLRNEQGKKTGVSNHHRLDNAAAATVMNTVNTEDNQKDSENAEHRSREGRLLLQAYQNAHRTESLAISHGLGCTSP